MTVSPARAAESNLFTRVRGGINRLSATKLGLLALAVWLIVAGEVITEVYR